MVTMIVGTYILISDTASSVVSLNNFLIKKLSIIRKYDTLPLLLNKLFLRSAYT